MNGSLILVIKIQVHLGIKNKEFIFFREFKISTLKLIHQPKPKKEKAVFAI